LLHGVPAPPTQKRGRGTAAFSHFTAHVLWPNGWMDQDATWHGSRPRPRPYCVRWRPSLPKKKWEQQPAIFGLCLCSQTTGWIKMPLGTKVGLGPGDILCLMGTQLSPKRGIPPIFSPCLLWPNGWMDRDATWYGGMAWPRPHCVRWNDPMHGHSSCDQTVADLSNC